MDPVMITDIAIFTSACLIISAVGMAYLKYTA